MNMMGPLFAEMGMDPELTALFMGSTQQSLMGAVMISLCTSLFVAPVGFLIGSGIYWIIAKLLGGTGSYGEQTYLLATFAAPLMIVNGLLNLIPLCGGLAIFLVLIYYLVLAYFALQVAHDFSGNKALATVATPILLGFMLGCCLGVTMGAAIASFFSEFGSSGF